MATVLAVVALGLVSSAQAQAPRAQTAKEAADADFRAVQAIAAPRSSLASSVPAAQADSDRRLQVASHVLASEKAKDFYSKNPGHEKATEAKKIEAESLLRAVQTGGIEHETKALRLARDFRADKTNPSLQRFQVAALVRELGVRKENYGESREDIMAAYERAAMDLYAEFPGEPAVYDMFLGVARNAEPVKAKSMATRVLLMPAPVAAKDEARTILARLDMPGKPLVAEWIDDAGAFHSVADYKGKIVVFYVWASWSPSTDAEQKIKSLVPASAVLVSVNVDQDPAVGRTAKTKSGVGGIAYYDKRSLDGPLPKQLRVNKVPGVYVVDRKGVFVGGGSPELLAGLLDAAK